MAKKYYINVDWGNGTSETLEECSEENRRDAFYDYYHKYDSGFRNNNEGTKVWCSTRATRSYYDKNR